MSGIPGIRPSRSPPITRVIGYGTLSQLAKALSPAAETNSAAMKICRSPTPGILYGRAMRRVRLMAVLSAIALLGAGDLEHVGRKFAEWLFVRHSRVVGEDLELGLDGGKTLAGRIELELELLLAVGPGHRGFL